MKYLIIGLLTMVFNFSFGNTARNLEVSFENLSFQKVAKSELTRTDNKIQAKGYITIELADGEEMKPGEVYESIIVVNFPKTAYISNTNQRLKIDIKDIVAYNAIGSKRTVEDSTIEKSGKQFPFDGTSMKLEIVGEIDINQIDSQKENVEGEYEGAIPLEIHQYIKKN